MGTCWFRQPSALLRARGLGIVPFRSPASGRLGPEIMNQTPQDTADAKQSSDTPERPPEHPRFAKPQRVAFVQSAWHREVVEECRIAFLDEAEARHIPRASIDVFEVP